MYQVEVVQTIAYPRRSKARRRALDKLCQEDNFHQRVLQAKSGQLIVMRRTEEDDNCLQDVYLPCIYCLGVVKKNDLWRHKIACKLKGGENGNGVLYKRCDAAAALH